MALTDVAVRNAKPKAKPYKLADEKGLYLLVTPAGGKLWRVKFRVAGKEKLLSLGALSEVSLAEARDQRDAARKVLKSGEDPAREKQREKHRKLAAMGDTFGSIGRDYLDKRKREGMAERTTDKAEYYLSRLTQKLGSLPISDITASDVLAVLRVYERQGKHETSNRLLQMASRIFRFAVANALLTSDPTRDLRGALTTPQVKHFAAIIDPKRAGELLRAIDGYEGMGITRLALQLSPHVFVRPGELRQAEWREVDLEAGVWIIPAEKMKMRKPHHVPLSRQSIAILREAHNFTGPSGFVFPSVRTRTRPMSENTVGSGLRRLGFPSDEMTAHGFRTMASTLLNESGKWSPDAIERALAHADTDGVRAAYHRGAHWKERVEMAQWWSDYLDTLRKGADIVQLRGQANA